MRSFHRLPLFPLLALLAAACGGTGDSGAESEAEGDTSLTLSVRPGTQQPPPDRVITLSLQGDDIVVTPEDAVVGRGAVVAWQSDPPDRLWIVSFPTRTPFQGPDGGKRVFHGGTPGQAASQGQIRMNEPYGESKYWVFFPNAQGEYESRDPKLVVVDNPGDTTAVGGPEE